MRNVGSAILQYLAASARLYFFLTDSLIFACNIIKDKIGGDLIIRDREEDYKLEDLSVKGGIFLQRDNEVIEIEELFLIFTTDKKVELSKKELADYYGWKPDRVDDKGNIYAHIDLDDMVGVMLNRNDNYKVYGSSLKDG